MSTAIARLKNQKGLTLIELLAVLVIIGIIAAIAIPAIGGTISNSKNKADVATNQVVKEAAMRYIIDKYSNTTTSPVNKNIATLVSQGYLNATPDYNVTANRRLSFTATLTGNSWAIVLNVDAHTAETADPVVTNP